MFTNTYVNLSVRVTCEMNVYPYKEFLFLVYYSPYLPLLVINNLEFELFECVVKLYRPQQLRIDCS